MQIEGWNVIDEDATVLWREYSFMKGGMATTLVFRGVDGLVVVSPSSRTDARIFDALAQLGPVRALIANNTFHHLGQPEWRARFPEAQSYAPPNSLEMLSKKQPNIKFHSMTELALPQNVHWEDPPGFKTGEALLRIATKRGPVYYTGDLLTNFESVPNWLFSLILRITNSAPGFRLFKPGVGLFVKDKKAVRAWMLDQLDKHPPTVVVPAHGPIVDASDVAEQARVQIRRL